MFRRISKPQNRIDSLIGGTTRIEGNILFAGGLRIDGTVRGNVYAHAERSGTLVVSQGASIEGEVRATHVIVRGTITGPVTATETLELQANSRVKGDVHYYKNIQVQQGAIIEGRMVHAAQVDAEGNGVELKLAAGG